MKFDTLIHLSGGMDSTYCLWRRLVDYPHERIFVHHIKLRHKAEDRLRQEETACRNIVTWLRARGLDNFVFMQSRFEYGDLPRISIKDIQIMSVFSAIILRTQNYTGFKHLILPWHHGEVYANENYRGFRVRAMLKALEAPEVELLFPIKDMTRADMAKDMPKGLLRLCWYCRRPAAGDKVCGDCKTCLEMKEAGL